MRQPGAPAGAVVEAGRVDTRAGATEGAEGGQEHPLWDCGHRSAEGRRGQCRTCYRKLREAGVELPPAGGRWDGHDRLRAWAQSLPEQTRAAIAKALEEV